MKRPIRMNMILLLLLLSMCLLAEPGHLVLSGGALKGNNAEIYGKIIELASEDINGDGKPDPGTARIGIITASSSDPYYSQDNGQYYETRFQQHGGYAEWIPIYYDPAYPTREYDPDNLGEIEAYYACMTGSAEVLAQINSMTGFFFGGGDQSRYVRVLLNNDHKDSPALALIRDKLFNQGAVVAGTSAGTAIQSGGNSELVISQDWNIYEYTEPDPGLPSGYVNAIYKEDNGRVWMCTDAGAGIYDDGIWIEYNEDNSGLTGLYSTIYDICQAKDGSFWFGTNGGIVHFNGSSWQYYDTGNAPLPSRKTYAVAIDADNTLWAGTTYGLVSFDGNEWVTYGQNEMNDLLIRAIEVETRPGGEQWIWIGSDGYTSGNDLSLSKYEKNSGNWEYFYYQEDIEEDEVFDIAIDSNNIKWIGGYRGLHSYNDTGFTDYDPYNKSAKSIALDSNDVPWIGFNYYGLVKLENDEFTYWATSNSEIPGNYLNDIWIDDEGTKWCATDGNGSACFSVSGNWEIFKEKIPPGLPDNLVNDILPMKTDLNDTEIWAATAMGLGKFNGNNWEIISEDILPDMNVLSLEKASTTLYVGTDTGLVRMVNDIWENPENAPAEQIKDIHYCERFPAECIWLATGEGIYQYDLDNTWTHYANELPGLDVNAITGDEDIIWIATDNGLAKLNIEGEFSVYNSEDWVLPTEHVTALAEDCTGGLYIGTDLGLLHFDGSCWTVEDSVTGTVNSLYSTGDILYAGTDKGLYVKSGNWVLWTDEDTELPGNRINCICSDNKGNKWIGTGSGMAQLIEGFPVTGDRIPFITGGISYRALLLGSTPHFTNEYDDLTYNPQGGFGFFPYGILDSHFSRRGRQGRAIRLAADTGINLVFGVDENTALVTYNVGSEDVYMEVLGQYRENGVNIIDNSEARTENNEDGLWGIHGLKTHYLTKHDKYYPLTKEVVFADWKNEISESGDDTYGSIDIFESTYNPRPNYQSDYLSEYMFISTRLFESSTIDTYGSSYEDSPEYKVRMIKDDYWNSQGYVGGYGSETYWSYCNLRVDVYPQLTTKGKQKQIVPACFSGNHPNPFNPSTTIKYNITESGIVEVNIYNIKGQKVNTLVKEEKSKGSYKVNWHGTNYSGNKVASGVYFCGIKHNGIMKDINKLMLLK